MQTANKKTKFFKFTFVPPIVLEKESKINANQEYQEPTTSTESDLGILANSTRLQSNTDKTSHNAHSSKNNPTETKNATLTSSSTVKSMKTVESNNKKNITNHKRDLTQESDLNSKTYKIHKIRRKLKHMDLSLDIDEAIVGSHRLLCVLCGEYKFPTLNKMNENRNVKSVGALSEIMDTFSLSNETNISNEYVEVTTSNKGGNLQLFGDQQGSYSSIDKN